MIQWIMELAIWSLVPLPFLDPAWISGSSPFTYSWSLAWRILVAQTIKNLRAMQVTLVRSLSQKNPPEKAMATQSSSLAWRIPRISDTTEWLTVFSAFSKSNLNIWKFMIHVLLKPSLENFEHYFASVWNECNCAVVWTFFGIPLLWDWNETLLCNRSPELFHLAKLNLHTPSAKTPYFPP